MQRITKNKIIWATTLIIFLVLTLSISTYLYMQPRGFSYFEHPPSYYDNISYTKLIIYSVFQLVSCIACGIFAISVWFDKLDIDYERLFCITCFSLCITIIILEYFKYWERMYDTIIAGYIIVGAMTMGIISLLVNIVVNFVKDKISNNYGQIEET